MILAAAEFANTIAGALAPAVSLVAVAFAGIASRRIGQHSKRTDDNVRRAEKAIRGDLRNGINARLTRLEQGQGHLYEAQHLILAELDNLKNSPPPHLS